VTFAQACGVHDAARAAACARVLGEIADGRVERVRIGWCDTHGVLRGKTLVVGPGAGGVAEALDEGIGMVGTTMLKDTSDRTAFKVFEPGLGARHAGLAGFECAPNLILLPDPASFVMLPWSPGTAWMRAQPWFAGGTPVPIDTRRVLQQALATLAEAGFGLRCGLEVEFHAYRITDDRLEPTLAAWPGEPPAVQMLHPGYNLLAEGWADMADAALAIVERTARGLRLPLRSLEVELGPSQFEAVFDAADALAAADAMVLFRNGVKQALRRAGYHASFVCRPPFPNVMASGWHLHHSLVDRQRGGNAFARAAPAPRTTALDAEHTLSAVGARWLAGLLAHARAMAPLCTPTVNGFGRFRPHALAPVGVQWGRDNRGAMLRVIGAAGDPGTRIENRIGEPMANPYLYFAAQVHAGLDGLRRALVAGPATEDPYAAGDSAGQRLPTSLAEALDALRADEVLRAGFGPVVIDWFLQIEHSALARHDAAEDKAEWDRREYFGRY
jgi:glutamine synthetase